MPHNLNVHVVHLEPFELLLHQLCLEFPYGLVNVDVPVGVVLNVIEMGVVFGGDVENHFVVCAETVLVNTQFREIGENVIYGGDGYFYLAFFFDLFANLVC